jgi:hypothetical protein
MVPHVVHILVAWKGMRANGKTEPTKQKIQDGYVLGPAAAIATFRLGIVVMRSR